MTIDLDDRQRAMLQEMGVRVWLPRSEVISIEPALAKLMPVTPKSARPGEVIATERIADKSLAPGTPDQTHGESQRPLVLGQTWSDLQSAVTSCRACKLCEGRTHTVFGVGPAGPDAQAAPKADWLIVGEAPGENEDRIGEPFVGQAGQLLDNMLKAMGASRQTNTYILNVVKCRPPGNRNPELAEIAQCEPFLRRQIELLQPKVILAMGRFAVNALLQASISDVAKLPLGKLRGQVHGYDCAGVTLPVIATYHPAYLLRNLPEKAKAWADLCLAMDTMKRLA